MNQQDSSLLAHFTGRQGYRRYLSERSASVVSGSKTKVTHSAANSGGSLGFRDSRLMHRPRAASATLTPPSNRFSNYFNAAWVTAVVAALVAAITLIAFPATPAHADTDSTSVTINTAKTAVLKTDNSGNYDLTLSFSGTQGSTENPAQVDILLLVDKSGSMKYNINNDSGTSRERMKAVVNALETLTETLEKNDSVDAQYNLITFSSLGYTNFDQDTGWTSNVETIRSAVSYFTEPNDRGQFKNSLEGGTNYEYAFSKANRALSDKSVRANAKQIVIFLTDGIPTNRGTIRWTEIQDNNNRNYANTTAATALLKDMNADEFYAIGIGPSFLSSSNDSPTNGSTNLNLVVSAAQKAKMTSRLFTTQSASDLEEYFRELVGSVTYVAASDVTVTDQLSEYVDLVLVNDSPQFTITVTDGTSTWTSAEGSNQLTFKDASDNDITVTAGYNATSKTITLDFPDDYELEKDYTYSVSTVVTPSSKAKSLGESGYNATGDANTGTHSGEQGFYSNATAEVVYKVNDTNSSTSFPKPVVQVGSPDPVTIGGASGNTGIEANKVLSGRDWQDGDSFSFVLTAQADTEGNYAPLPDGAEDGSITATIAYGDESKTVDFGEITYDTAGSYTYTITEAVPTDDNQLSAVTYDDTVYTATVTVTNDGGILTASVAYATGDKAASSATFTNTYYTDLDYTEASGIAIQKTLEDHAIAAGQFEFTITATNDNAQELLGDDTKVISSTAAAMDSDSGNAVEILNLFGSVQFTNADSGKTYTFTVAETQGGDTNAGYTNDSTVYTLTIEVSDNSNAGTLEVTTTVVGDNGYSETYTHTSADSEYDTVLIPFTNVYAATGELGGEGGAGNTFISATKTTNGRSMTEGEYSFTVTANNGSDSKQYATGTNAAAADSEAGTVTFSTIEYTKAELNQDAIDGYARYSNVDGWDTYTYTYTVSEVTDGLADSGITPRTSSFQITVTVTDNNDGTLSISVTYPEGSDDTLTFANTYQTNEVSLNFNGAKLIDINGVNTAPTLVDVEGAYTFTLTGEEGAPMPDSTTANNDATGTIDFGRTIFSVTNVFDKNDEYGADGTRSKTFTYTVSESGTVAGVTNSGEQAFTITVTDNGKGELTVTTDPAEGALFTFINVYEPASTEVTFTASKTLQGGELKADQFSFQLVGADENSPMPADADGTTATVANAADGSISFGVIEYANTGTYEYAVSEVNDGQERIAYDGTVYTVTVTVTDDGQGQLHAAVVAANGDNAVDTMAFTNIQEQVAAAEQTGDGDSLAKTGAMIAIPTVVTLLCIAAAVWLTSRKRRNA